MGNSADAKIDAMLAIVRQQRQEVVEREALVRQPWETNCSYRMDGNTPTNIQTATVSTVHAVMTDLILRNHAAAEAAAVLGISLEKPLFCGYTYSQWVADLKKRIAKIQLEEKKKALDTAEQRLNQLISPEKRRELEVQALEKELGITK